MPIKGRRTQALRLASIAAVTGIGFVVLIFTSTVIDARVRDELRVIQQRYVPKVELQPRLTAQLEKIRRGFQDAVQAQDIETLTANHMVLDEFSEMLAAASLSISPSDANHLRMAVKDYYVAGIDVARRLMGNESGEPLMQAIATMQTAEKNVQTLITTYAGADRELLDSAFASIVAAQTEAGRLRLLIASGVLLVIGCATVVWTRQAVRDAMTGDMPNQRPPSAEN